MKDKIEILLLTLVVLLQSSHLVFDLSGMRADIFLFYDYPNDGRLVSMLLYEISKYFALCTVSFLLWYRVRNPYYLVFFIWFMYDFVTYLLFFGQSTNLVGLPLLGVLLFIVWSKKKN
jgi:hypothetical protein